MHVNTRTVVPPEWRVPVEEAWSAYAAGTVPVGAAIVDPAGRVVSRGRNRIFDDPVPGQIGRTRLAHAEVNAILGLPTDGTDPVEIFRKADDRLYGSKLVGRNLRTVAEAAASTG